MSSAAVMVNDLPLPPGLVELIEAGRWKLPGNVDEVRRLTGLDDADQLLFFGVESMRAEMRHLFSWIDREPERRLLGLESSKRSGHQVHAAEILDVELAILIAATFGDGWLCLDYRNNVDRPAVVVSDWSGPGCKWREIAPDIETFASLLKL